MPAAAIPIATAVIGAAGSAASASGGKKAQGKANQIAQQQLGLQQQQFGLTKQQVGLGNAALSPAATYFQQLLQGGQAARLAVSPSSQLIGQVGEGAQRAIQAGVPRGGEQNLALSQNRLNTAGQIANLYTGVQPAAASALGQLGGVYLGSGSALSPFANTGAALGSYGQQQQLASQSGSGFGNLLFNGLKKIQSGSGGLGGGGKAEPGGGGGGTPPFLPAGKG